MNLSDYQKKSRETWISNDKDLERIVLGICGESGEIAEFFKKKFRGDKPDDFVEDRLTVAKETGDILFYIARLADFYMLDLDQIAELNNQKLQDRKNRGVIKGSGDSR
jgi:NTP pyrophosphatase (non-canonical NTP hydrolase)